MVKFQLNSPSCAPKEAYGAFQKASRGLQKGLKGGGLEKGLQGGLRRGRPEFRKEALNHLPSL